eukprot:COSAG01_NODE_524_length_15931_cov_72.340491_6_plen_391_part_00
MAARADVDAQNTDGYSALMLACYWKHAEMVPLLLGSGADPSLRSKTGRSCTDDPCLSQPMRRLLDTHASVPQTRAHAAPAAAAAGVGSAVTRGAGIMVAEPPAVVVPPAQPARKVSDTRTPWRYDPALPSSRLAKPVAFPPPPSPLSGGGGLAVAAAAAATVAPPLNIPSVLLQGPVRPSPKRRPQVGSHHVRATPAADYFGAQAGGGHRVAVDIGGGSGGGGGVGVGDDDVHAAEPPVPRRTAVPSRRPPSPVRGSRDHPRQPAPTSSLVEFEAVERALVLAESQAESQAEAQAQAQAQAQDAKVEAKAGTEVQAPVRPPAQPPPSPAVETGRRVARHATNAPPTCRHVLTFVDRKWLRHVLGGWHVGFCQRYVSGATICCVCVALLPI